MRGATSRRPVVRKTISASRRGRGGFPIRKVGGGGGGALSADSTTGVSGGAVRF